jgi:hypothetical protein
MGQELKKDHINAELNKISVMTNVISMIEAEKKLGLHKITPYIEADSFTGNPYSLLGRVIEVRKGHGEECPNSIVDPNSQIEFSMTQVVGFEEDKSARLNAPVQRGSIIVNQELSLKLGFLNFLSAQLDTQTTFSLIVFDEAAGLVNTNSILWTNAVNEWKTNNAEIMNDPDVCYVFTVIGFVQKNIIKKRFKEFNVGQQGGFYGLNLDGKLYTSTEDFSLDIRFGLTPAIIKRPQAQKTSMGFVPKKINELDSNEKALFSSLNNLKFSGNSF